MGGGGNMGWGVRGVVWFVEGRGGLRRRRWCMGIGVRMDYRLCRMGRGMNWCKGSSAL